MFTLLLCYTIKQGLDSHGFEQLGSKILDLNLLSNTSAKSNKADGGSSKLKLKAAADDYMDR